ncbi:MAG: DUF2029 domain-containing protein [Chloroflexi bacterium]|nr:DUF2029 domain-containing protein [Chloroflexota bacterium]
MDLPYRAVTPDRMWSPIADARWRDVLRVACITVGLAALVVFLLAVISQGPGGSHGYGFDTRSYWGFPRAPMYPGPGTDDGYGIYRYSPAFVPLMSLATLLPWHVFALMWMGIQAAAFLWLAGDHRLPALAFLPVLFELYLGNVHLLLAVAVVLGFRWPATWAFVLLTKITPGVGLLWFAVRREWRSLAIAIGATIGIVAIGLLVSPEPWRQWIQSIAVTDPAVGTNQVALPLFLRLALAVGLVIWGARTDRRWTVVVAATLGLPTMWFHGLAMLVGIVALQAGQPERTAAAFERWGARLRASLGGMRTDLAEP